MNLPPGLLQKIQLPDFNVSWAGAGPVRNGFCFGSEHGKLLFTDELGVTFGKPGKASAAEEAINGVADSHGWLAVTTRADVNFLELPKPSGESPRGTLFPGGAHGVVTAPSGYFVAPLGRKGILFVKPGAGREDLITISSADNEEFYFYRVIALPGKRGEDLIVCAGRRGGIGVAGFAPDLVEHRLSTVTIKNLDVVDVCHIGSAGNSLALAAVGRDGTLIFIRDVLRDKTPQTLRFDGVQGTAYRLLSAHGDLYLLTSKTMYVLAKLAAGFLEGVPLGTFLTKVVMFPTEVVDANLVCDRWLLVVTPDEVLKYDVELIHQIAPEHLGPGEVQELRSMPVTLEWEEHGVAQKTTQVLSAV